MPKNKLISEDEFDKLCKYVCRQLPPSGSEDLDIETLNFAIYWQVCCIFDEHLQFVNTSHSKINFYRRNLEILLHERVTQQFDLLQIVDKNIFEKVCNNYTDQLTLDHRNISLSINE